jgi:hypothetical protein
MSEERDAFRDEDEDEDEALSLQPMVRTLWSYRRAIKTALGLTLVLCVLAGAFAYAWAPKERVASLGFQLTFEGADRGEYPNGTKFSSAEIVSTPVLTEVFKANDLQRYTTFSKFKDGMFVLQTNRDLELLSFEYTAKLSDSKLGPVDRARLEEEFRRKRESLSAAGFSLNIRRSEGLIGIPNASLSKILQDTLSTWASQTAEKKGATRYNIPVLSKNALQRDFLTSEDYIISADILRTKIERILKSVVAMAEIPGASAVRMNEQVGLADLRANLEDLNRFKVEPLISLIRESGLSRNPARIGQYFEGRLVEVQLARTEAEQRIKSLQDALLGYEQRGTVVSGATATGPTSAVTPQLSESFIDRLVQMSTQSIDVDYRQGLTKRIIDDGMVLAELKRQAEYYELMRRAFASVQGRPDGSVASDVTRRMGQAYDEVARSIDQVQAFYALISQQNLNPDTVVYTVTTPFLVRTTSALSFSTMLLYTIVVLLVAVIMIPLACLAHDYFQHWISPPHATHATRDDASRATGSRGATGL